MLLTKTIRHLLHFYKRSLSVLPLKRTLAEMTLAARPFSLFIPVSVTIITRIKLQYRLQKYKKFGK